MNHVKKLIEENYIFYINSIVYFEFINTLEYEIKRAKETYNKERLKRLKILQEKFPKLLQELHIQLLTIPIEWGKTENFLEQMTQYRMNIGDILILETITEHKVDVLLTTDKDWSRTEINVILI